MEWIAYIIAGVFTVLGLGCLVLAALQLAGGWIMFALALLIEWADRFYLPADDRVTFGWWVLGICLGLLAIAEAVELLASMFGAKKGGASRAGMVGSLLGGIIGAIGLAGSLSIIPGIGTVIGVLLGAILGTFLGALIAEIGVANKSVRGSVRPAVGATIGRIIGTTSKVAVAIIVWLTLSFAAWL